jgi:hypothetical protein
VAVVGGLEDRRQVDMAAALVLLLSKFQTPLRLYSQVA